MALRLGIACGVLAILAAISSGSSARAQDCTDTADGRVCRVTQPIRLGTLVDVITQRQLGLVTVNGGCSGTLLNRYWVLTARHCVTTDSSITGMLGVPEDGRISAAWLPGQVGIPSRYRDFAINAAAGSSRDRDMVLIYLGKADLGPVDNQRIYVIARDEGGGSVRLSGRLRASDTVTQYGRGFDTFATGVFGGTPAAVQATGLGTYRSGRFTPSNISATHYDLTMNAGNQVGHGGDSGGPSVVTVNNAGIGIAGVQSTCAPTGYVPNAPSRTWPWATGITLCSYVATEPFESEIRTAIRETPHCPLGPACAIPAIVYAAMQAAN
ncbi:MAG: trypsin-like serine protease [Candidatus Kaistia colombiensis]|nr:MAG: trypsin-like serine protease [Kaistia sp.]